MGRRDVIRCAGSLGEIGGAAMTLDPDNTAYSTSGRSSVSQTLMCPLESSASATEPLELQVVRAKRRRDSLRRLCRAVAARRPLRVLTLCSIAIAFDFANRGPTPRSRVGFSRGCELRRIFFSRYRQRTYAMSALAIGKKPSLVDIPRGSLEASEGCATDADTSTTDACLECASSGRSASSNARRGDRSRTPT